MHTPHLFERVYGESREYDPCGEDISCYEFSPDYTAIRQRVNNNNQNVRLLYSPTSEAIAIWEDGKIEIRDAHHVINEVLLDASSIAHPDYAIWHPNGQLLAYTDRSGLWLWDVYNSASEPTLLIPSQVNSIPIPQQFSPLGTYLSVEIDNQINHINILTEQHLPDGLFSPDEQLLLAYDTQSDVPTNLSLCVVDTMVCDTEGDAEILADAVWINNTQYMFNQCLGLLDDFTCNLRVNTFASDLLFELEGHQLFAYQSSTELVAILHSDTLLSIRKRDVLGFRYLMEIDVANIIDSPIQSIEWLPSFFYQASSLN